MVQQGAAMSGTLLFERACRENNLGILSRIARHRPGLRFKLYPDSSAISAARRRSPR
jgi:hypothetical protein